MCDMDVDDNDGGSVGGGGGYSRYPAKASCWPLG